MMLGESQHTASSDKSLWSLDDDLGSSKESEAGRKMEEKAVEWTKKAHGHEARAKDLEKKGHESLFPVTIEHLSESISAFIVAASYCHFSKAIDNCLMSMRRTAPPIRY